MGLGKIFKQPFYNARTMKVLFISSGNINGGISPIIKNQSESLRNVGLTIEHFTINGKGLISYLRHIYLLKKYLQFNKYDLYHAHYGLSGMVAFLAKRNGKLVVSFMGDDLIGSIGPRNKYKLSSKLISKTNIILSEYFYDFSIVKSDNLLKILASSKNREKVPNGVDIKKFCYVDKMTARKKVGFTENKKYVLFTSDPTRYEKNYDLALKSVKLLADKNIELVVTKNVNVDYMVYYYNASDCLILTSFHEGSPNVIKEAMACSRPIVSTNVGDIKWVFGKTDGCFLTSFDPYDVAVKLERALVFEEKAGKTEGRERIISIGLDSYSIAKKIIKIYQTVIA